jgi:hypothetical protein
MITMSADDAEPGVPDDPTFVAARMRATARDGVLAGRYVLVDGELLRQAYAAWSPQGVHVVVSADYPGAGEDALTGRWIAQVPHAQVTMRVSFTTLARHREGGVLDLQAGQGDSVRAIWWRGLNNDAVKTIPDGFVWEKNDDYYHGYIRWDELHDVTVSPKFHAR